MNEHKKFSPHPVSEAGGEIVRKHGIGIKELAIAALAIIIVAAIADYAGHPATTQTEEADSSSGLSSLFASATTIPLMTDTGESYNIPITAKNKYDEIIPFGSIVEISNLRCAKNRGEITGEIKSASSETINGIQLNIYNDANFLVAFKKTYAPEQRMRSGQVFNIDELKEIDLSKIRIEVLLTQSQ